MGVRLSANALTPQGLPGPFGVAPWRTAFANGGKTRVPTARLDLRMGRMPSSAVAMPIARGDPMRVLLSILASMIRTPAALSFGHFCAADSAEKSRGFSTEASRADE
jgi:hypothetical protein